MADDEFSLDDIEDVDEDDGDDFDDLEDESIVPEEEQDDEDVVEESSDDSSDDLALDEDGSVPSEKEELDPTDGSLPDPEEASQSIKLGQKVQTDPIVQYKGKEGLVDRVGIFTADVQVVKTQWHEEIGRFYAFPEANEVLGMPNVHYIIPVVKYDTDKSGNLSSKDVDMQYLKLAESRYEELLFAADDDPSKLVGSDVKIKCTDEDYQEFKFKVLDSEKPVFQKSSEIKQKIEEKAPKALKHLETAVARKITPETFFEETEHSPQTTDATDEFTLD